MQQVGKQSRLNSLCRRFAIYFVYGVRWRRYGTGPGDRNSGTHLVDLHGIFAIGRANRAKKDMASIRLLKGEWQLAMLKRDEEGVLPSSSAKKVQLGLASHWRYSLG